MKKVWKSWSMHGLFGEPRKAHLDPTCPLPILPKPLVNRTCPPGQLDFSGVGMVGIVLGGAALILLGATAWRMDAGHAIAPALLAVLDTTMYSLSDKVAEEKLPGFASQLVYDSQGYLCARATLTLRLRRWEMGRWQPRQRPPLGLLATAKRPENLATVRPYSSKQISRRATASTVRTSRPRMTTLAMPSRMPARRRKSALPVCSNMARVATVMAARGKE